MRPGGEARFDKNGADMSKRPQDSDIEFIRALAELLRENDLTEIEVNRDYGEEDALTVRVARLAPAQAMMPAPAPPQLAPAPAPAAIAAPGPADPSEDPGVVPSPMVGTAYMQGEPGTPPFVKVGDTVTEGQTILIIEAMKTMNQIPAPRAGRVKRILVEDGQPVEFGAPLIILE
jgi:acetyl-CoA carboxylase biotin carboxyl carrier protein